MAAGHPPAISVRAHTVRQLRVVATTPNRRSNSAFVSFVRPYPSGVRRYTSVPTTANESSPYADGSIVATESADGVDDRNVTCHADAGPANGWPDTIDARSAADRSNTGTSNPAADDNAEDNRDAAARDDEKTTLPLCRYVRASVPPTPATTSRRAVIGSFRPPTLTARNNPIQTGTDIPPFGLLKTTHKTAEAFSVPGNRQGRGTR